MLSFARCRGGGCPRADSRDLSGFAVWGKPHSAPRSMAVIGEGGWGDLLDEAQSPSPPISVRRVRSIRTCEFAKFCENGSWLDLSVFFYDGALTDIPSLWALQMKNESRRYEEIKRKWADGVVGVSQEVCGCDEHKGKLCALEQITPQLLPMCSVCTALRPELTAKLTPRRDHFQRVLLQREASSCKGGRELKFWEILWWDINFPWTTGAYKP